MYCLFVFVGLMAATMALKMPNTGCSADKCPTGFTCLTTSTGFKCQITKDTCKMTTVCPKGFTCTTSDMTPGGFMCTVGKDITVSDTTKNDMLKMVVLRKDVCTKKPCGRFMDCMTMKTGFKCTVPTKVCTLMSTMCPTGYMCQRDTMGFTCMKKGVMTETIQETMTMPMTRTFMPQMFTGRCSMTTCPTGYNCKQTTTGYQCMVTKDVCAMGSACPTGFMCMATKMTPGYVCTKTTPTMMVPTQVCTVRPCGFGFECTPTTQGFMCTETRGICSMSVCPVGMMCKTTGTGYQCMRTGFPMGMPIMPPTMTKSFTPTPFMGMCSTMTCPRGFTCRTTPQTRAGYQCVMTPDMCTKTTMCPTGFTCTPSTTGYRCTKTTGIMGIVGQTHPDTCTMMKPCSTGFQCMNTQVGFKCVMMQDVCKMTPVCSMGLMCRTMETGFMCMKPTSPMTTGDMPFMRTRTCSGQCPVGYVCMTTIQGTEQCVPQTDSSDMSQSMMPMSRDLLDRILLDMVVDASPEERFDEMPMDEMPPVVTGDIEMSAMPMSKVDVDMKMTMTEMCRYNPCGMGFTCMPGTTGYKCMMKTDMCMMPFCPTGFTCKTTGRTGFMCMDTKMTTTMTTSTTMGVCTTKTCPSGFKCSTSTKGFKCMMKTDTCTTMTPCPTGMTCKTTTTGFNCMNPGTMDSEETMTGTAGSRGYYPFGYYLY